MPTSNPNGIDGATVTLTGMQVHRAADLLQDQLYDVVEGFSIAVEKGLCSGTREESSRAIADAIDDITNLRDQLEVLGYGDADGGIQIPLGWLFPQLREPLDAAV